MLWFAREFTLGDTPQGAEEAWGILDSRAVSRIIRAVKAGRIDIDDLFTEIASAAKLSWRLDRIDEDPPPKPRRMERPVKMETRGLPPRATPPAPPPPPRDPKPRKRGM